MPDHIQQGESVEWNSPKRVLDPVREFFEGAIHLDPCGNDSSIVGAEVEYKLPTTNGLEAPWNVKGPGTKAYINPAFGRCYVRGDRVVVLSAKQWTNGRKLWRNFVKGVHPLLSQDDIVTCGAITDAEAARFTSSSVHDWFKKAAWEYQGGGVQSLLLAPAAVDTATWQQTAFPTATAVCWIKGRLSFLSGNKPLAPAPMACAVLGWVDDTERFLKVFSQLGTCHLLGIHEKR